MASSARPLCQFYVRNGTCRNDTSCRFSHDLGNLTRTQALKTIPCPYFQKGLCRFGENCELKHEEPAPPAFATSAGANDSPSQNDCCGICLEPCERFGILSCCNHVFCFSCIMEWRTEGSEEVSSRRVCPTCRKESDYVVPSHTLPKTEQEKLELLRNYKERLAQIPCRNWEGELGSCPFGRDCFYAHLDDDGKDIKDQDRSMQQLYEERQRHRDSRREGYDMEMIEQLILMGMQRNLFDRDGSIRRREQRDRQGRGRGRDDSDEESEDGIDFRDHFMNYLFRHFLQSHMNEVHVGFRHSDSDSTYDEDSGSDSSMPPLEDVPRANNAGRSDQSRPPLRDSQIQTWDFESDWESEGEESDSDESMPELEDMPARHR